MGLFGEEKNVKDSVREAQQVNRRGKREIESELRRVEREEAQLVVQLKQQAKRSPGDAGVKALAKQLVSVRKSKEQLQRSAAQLGTVNSNMKMQSAMHTTAMAMGSSAAAMGKVTAAMDPAKVANTMQAFAQQSAQADMAAEMMDDALDSMFEVGEGEADELIDEVLDEIGVNAIAGAQAAPARPVLAQQVPQQGRVQATGDAEVDAILAQLNQ